MYKLYFLLYFFFFASSIHAQSVQSVDSNGMALQKVALKIQEDTMLVNRLKADSLFTRQLVQQLKSPFSFNFKFDSLKAIKVITSPDRFFKFFSWQIDLGDGTFRQRGAMQFYTLTGDLKLLPFFDNSDFIQNQTLGITDRKKWIGAIYYDIIPILFNQETIYTLLGFDENTEGISKKIIEILRFDKGEPQLGGDYFIYPEDPTYPLAKVDRFIYQYKKGSNAVIKYDPLLKRIVISELASAENDLKKPETLVPSGNEKYFSWSNGHWVMPKN